MKQKTLFALTSLFCGCLTFVMADRPADQNNTKPANQQNDRVITPSAQPVVEYGADFFITADFIWWKANAEQTDYAVDGFTPVASATAASGHVRKPGFQFEPGFKVGAGLTFEHDGWDLYANYTWLRQGNKGTSVAASATDTVRALYTTDVGTDAFGAYEIDPALAGVGAVAGGEWNMHFNNLDVELGRNFWVSRYLALRPHVGLKTAWIHQKENVGYASAAGATAEVQNKQRFWGLGIRTGIDSMFHFCKSFGLYGDFALAALWTDFDDSRTDTHVNAAGTVTTRSLRTKNDPHTIEPVLELGLGLFYQAWFHHDSYMFSLSAGWEEQIWLQHVRFVDVPNYRQGNFTLQGLTVQAGFSF